MIRFPGDEVSFSKSVLAITYYFAATGSRKNALRLLSFRIPSMGLSHEQEDGRKNISQLCPPCEFLITIQCDRAPSVFTGGRVDASAIQAEHKAFCPPLRIVFIVLLHAQQLTDVSCTE